MSEPRDTASLLARLGELPAMPALVADLIASLDDENIDFDVLGEKIARDPVLASKTLRVANSPFFGMAGHIGSVREAITVLGLRTIRSLALASAVVNLSRSAAGHFNAQAFWLHAFETASAARALASVHRISPDQAFLAGLLHDLGKLAIVLLDADALQQAGHGDIAEESVWLAAEQAGQLPSHTALGGALAEHWRFPSALCTAIARHHPPVFKDDLAATVHVADILAQAHAATQGRQHHTDPLDPQAWAGFANQDGALAKAAIALRQAHALTDMLG